MDETEDFVDWKIKHKKSVPKRVKYVLLFLSYVFWISGATFAAIGGWTISQSVRYGSLSNFAAVPGAVAAALGCFTFTFSTLGVLGTLRENLCHLKTYKICLIIVLVFELCTGLVGFAFWPELKKMAEAKMRLGIVQYDDNMGLRFVIDQVQRQFECCGSLTVDDWDSSRYYRCKFVAGYRACGVPWSCCHLEFQRNRQCGLSVRRRRNKMSKRIYTISCLDKLFEFFKVKTHWIGGLALVINFPLILGIYLSTRMIHQIKKLTIAFNEANENYHWFEDTISEDQAQTSEADDTHLI